MKRIAILVERDRAYGRGLCEGIADAALEHADWRLELVDSVNISTPGILNGFDGAIVRIPNDQAAKVLERYGIPVVDVYSSGCSQKYYRKFGRVDNDQASIGVKAAEYLLSRRFTSFAFCGYNGLGYSDLRCAAFAKTVATHGCRCEVFQASGASLAEFGATQVRHESMTKGADEKRLIAWLQSLPARTAVFCCQDLRAYQVAAACQECGIAVPERLALLGVDNDRLICSYTAPTLSSIDNVPHRVGAVAVEVLAEMLSSAAARRRPPSRFVPSGEVFPRASSEIWALEPKWLSDALVYIERNLSRTFAVEEVVALTGKSYPTVECAFREQFGETVRRTILRLRMTEARRLLASSPMSIVEIAAKTGFASAQYFCRVFKDFVGVTAGEYRQSMPAMNAAFREIAKKSIDFRV